MQGRRGKETLAASKGIQESDKRVTRSMANQDKLSMLAQVAEAMEEWAGLLFDKVVYWSKKQGNLMFVVKP